MATEKEITFETEESTGAVNIAGDVVVTIAAQGLKDVSGIRLASNIAGDIVDKLVGKSSARGIRIYLDDEAKQVDIDVHISILYGVNIPEVAWKVQEAVKKNVETMTDILVQKVNVFVDGVIIEKEPKPEKPKKAKKDAAKKDEAEPETEMAIDDPDNFETV